MDTKANCKKGAIVSSLINKYNHAPDIKLPYLAREIEYKPGGKPIRISGLGGKCQQCGTRIKNPRGSVDEYARYIEFNYIGLCPICHVATGFHFRFYPKDRRVLQEVSRGWREIAIVPKTKFPILRIIRHIFYKLVQMLIVFK